MRRSSWSGVDCSIAQTLDVVGDPWTLLVVRDAFFGLRRFEDFRRSLGIPRATLSARLATLVDHGVMVTREYSDQPVRHEYLLTAKGRALGPILVAMLQWGDEWSAPDGPPDLPRRRQFRRTTDAGLRRRTHWSTTAATSASSGAGER